MPKPRIAILNQGLPSLTLAELTHLPLVDRASDLDYLLGYGELHGPLVQSAPDELAFALLGSSEPKDISHDTGKESFILWETGTTRRAPTSAAAPLPTSTMVKVVLPNAPQQALYLQLQPTMKTQGTIVVDGLQGTLGFRRHPGRLLHEPLIKAVGANKNYQPSVIDATAGWGTDAFLLASFGCRVTLIEANPLVGVLLADGLRRWQENHMDLMLGHAVDIIPELATADFPEVIYLDPMFPARQKTALVKKNMAFLQQWLDETTNPQAETLLLNTARRYAKKRVVVKRPQSAPYLADIKPSGAITTKHHRYDIYAPL